MIRLGIVGSNYGCAVLAPAFRLDARCKVVALAGARADRAREMAQQADIATVCSDWRQLVAAPDVDAVAVATPPRVQPDIAVAALAAGKPVFAEKPMAGDLAAAKAMLKKVGSHPTMIDFGFTEIAAWRRTKAIIDEGRLGRLRHVAVTWHVENASTRLRAKNWKTDIATGGGALGNFVSHSLHYVEWLFGPLVGLSGRLAGLPDDPAFQTNVICAFAFASGASGSYSMSCAAFGGSGHRLEIYGDDGALTLHNPTADYMRGFTLTSSDRKTNQPAPIALDDDPLDRQFPHDGRIAPVSRLAKRFLDAVENGGGAKPDFADGYRVQFLMDAVRRSHDGGRWIDVKETT
ncbi:MAG: Gfo/Idh/MocA family protein [Pseudolabrys sp.]